MQNVFSYAALARVDAETIGDRLRCARAASNLTLHELSVAAGLSPGAISDIENGRQKSSTRLHRLAAALGVTPDWLETGTTGPTAVADVFTIRRNNLRALLASEAGGKQVNLANRLGVPQNLVSRWLARKRIGHNTARRCEREFGLGYGTMDQPLFVPTVGAEDRPFNDPPAPGSASAPTADVAETALSQLINNWFASDANGRVFIEQAAKLAAAAARTEGSL